MPPYLPSAELQPHQQRRRLRPAGLHRAGPPVDRHGHGSGEDVPRGRRAQQQHFLSLTAAPRREGEQSVQNQAMLRFIQNHFVTFKSIVERVNIQCKVMLKHIKSLGFIFVCNVMLHEMYGHPPYCTSKSCDHDVVLIPD